MQRSRTCTAKISDSPYAASGKPFVRLYMQLMLKPNSCIAQVELDMPAAELLLSSLCTMGM